jgi:hypothetical protein
MTLSSKIFKKLTGIFQMSKIVFGAPLRRLRVERRQTGAVF